ncbi:MAG: hypothetical protein V1933_00425 [Candidatus Omnitrophota bacterium]
MKKGLMMGRLLLLDADVVIELHKLGYWKGITGRYKIHIASTVLKEVTHYLDDSGKKTPIDLSGDINSGKVKEESASLQEIQILLQRIPRDKIDLDAGELESVTIISSHSADELKICVIDKAAIKALSFLDLRDRAFSFEEVLINCGIWKKGDRISDPRFTKKRFESWAAEGDVL